MKQFSDFQKNINFDKLKYDMSKIADKSLLQSSDLFTQEQYEFLTNTTVVMLLGLLRQYHEWLSEEN